MLREAEQFRRRHDIKACRKISRHPSRQRRLHYIVSHSSVVFIWTEFIFEQWASGIRAETNF
jgi:hypothetical protein